MDLTTYNDFVVNWEENSGVVTMTFKDSAGTITLDVITIQAIRLRSFLDSLAEVALVYAPVINDSLDREYCRTEYSLGQSKTEF